MKKKKNNLSKIYRESFSYIKESKKFIYFVIGIFLIFSLIGFFLPIPDILETKIIEFIENLILKTENMSQLELTKFIFFNNLQSSFIGMIFGSILGVFPILTTIANGYLLGFVASRAVEGNGILTLWRLFPHGIFELPALFISLGLGLKMGSFIFEKDKLASFRNYITNSVKVFIFVVIPLLIIAALIEGALIAISG